MTASALVLSSEIQQVVQEHCERTGLPFQAAVDDLIQRGAQQVDVSDVSDAVEDIRSVVLDTHQALDALAPYAIAALSLMAHWATHSGTTKVNEVDYAEEARNAGRATWDGHLLARGIPVPLRPAADEPAADPAEGRP